MYVKSNFMLHGLLRTSKIPSDRLMSLKYLLIHIAIFGLCVHGGQILCIFSLLEGTSSAPEKCIARTGIHYNSTERS